MEIVKSIEPRAYYPPETLQAMRQAFGDPDGDGQYPEMGAYKCPAAHMRPTINRRMRDNVIERCVQILKNVDYDTLAFQGASGIGISLILAHLLKKEVILVRKRGEPRQSGATNRVEGYQQVKRYIVVDDLISTGMTAARVIRNVRAFAPNAELVGILLYYAQPSLLTADSDDYQLTWRHVMKLVESGDLSGEK